MKIKLLILLVVMCLCLVSCDLGNLEGMLGSGSGSSNEETAGSVPGSSESIEGDSDPSDETVNSDIQGGTTEVSSDVETDVSSDVTDNGVSSDVQTDISSDLEDEEGATDTSTENSGASESRGSDIIDDTVDTELDEENKDEIRDELEDLMDALDKIEKDETLTEDAKKEAISNEYYSAVETLKIIEDTYKEQIDEFFETNNEIIKEVGNALLNNDKQKLNEIIKIVKYYNKEFHTKTWAEIFNSLNEEFEKFMGSEKISQELKDIVFGYKDTVEKALEKYGIDSEEEIKELVSNAIDEFSNELISFMEAHFDKVQRFKNMVELLEKKLGIFDESKDDNEEMQKPDAEQPSEKPNEEPKDDVGTPDIEEIVPPAEPSDNQVFIPGIGNISIDALLDEETLNKEFDKMFGRPITEEEKKIIEAYLDFIKEENKEPQKPDAEQPSEKPNEEPKDDVETPDIEEIVPPAEPGDNQVFIPGIGNISDALLDEETLNKEFDKMFGRPITEEERELIEAYLQQIK